MTELAVITPSFRGDAELFADLHRSVLEFTSEKTIHHVLVSQRDLPIFRDYEGPRCRVWNRSEMLTSRYLPVPGRNMHVNVFRPWPPLRGWVMQQTAKIVATAQMDADVVLLLDSDAVLVRPVTADRFRVDGRLVLHRVDDAVTDRLERHVIWHQVGRTLLGLPPGPPPPLPDYISPVNVWDPAIVRAMQARLSEVAGRDWMAVFNAQRHISEFMLYGLFVDQVLQADPPVDTTIAHMYFSRSPLSHDEALAFVDQLPREAVALMISAKTHTPLDVRRAAIRHCAEVVAAG